MISAETGPGFPVKELLELHQLPSGAVATVLSEQDYIEAYTGFIALGRGVTSDRSVFDPSIGVRQLSVERFMRRPGGEQAKRIPLDTARQQVQDAIDKTARINRYMGKGCPGRIGDIIKFGIGMQTDFVVYASPPELPPDIVITDAYSENTLDIIVPQRIEELFC